MAQIIIALDTDNLVKAKNLVRLLYPRIKIFKIGLEFINTGKAPELIKFINKLGGKVFYDIKLNDIPNTVAKTVKVISKMAVWGFTIHASSGKESLRCAVLNKGKSKVIGVTILTSQDVSERKVISLAKILSSAEVDGIVCSAREAKTIKKFGKIIITPGVRPSWADKNDQKRITTPEKAIAAGSDYLVIGRPITDSPKPLEAVKQIIKEIR